MQHRCCCLPTKQQLLTEMQTLVSIAASPKSRSEVLVAAPCIVAMVEEYAALAECHVKHSICHTHLKILCFHHSTNHKHRLGLQHLQYIAAAAVAAAVACTMPDINDTLISQIVGQAAVAAFTECSKCSSVFPDTSDLPCQVST